MSVVKDVNLEANRCLRPYFSMIMMMMMMMMMLQLQCGAGQIYTSFGLYDEVHLSAQPFSTSFGGCAFVDMMNKICVV